MELVFNEISFKEYKDDYGLLSNFILLGELFENAKSLYGYNHILFPSNLSVMQATSKKNFGMWLKDIPTKERNKILPIIFKKPFSEEYLGDRANQLAQYYFVSKELGIVQEYCDGLATSDIMDIPAISLKNHSIWVAEKLDIFKETENNPLSVQVNNVSTTKILNSESFKSYSESIAILDLQVSPFSLNEKKQRISLRDDHGKDVLQKFAEKLIRNEYVNGVVNSLPFNSFTSRFIKSVYKNGLIEIVLHWEDAGYGLVVESTGRNFRETDEIAKILRDKFDK